MNRARIQISLFLFSCYLFHKAPVLALTSKRGTCGNICEVSVFHKILSLQACQWVADNAAYALKLQRDWNSWLLRHWCSHHLSYEVIDSASCSNLRVLLFPWKWWIYMRRCMKRTDMKYERKTEEKVGENIAVIKQLKKPKAWRRLNLKLRW